MNYVHLFFVSSPNGIPWQSLESKVKAALSCTAVIAQGFDTDVDSVTADISARLSPFLSYSPNLKTNVIAPTPTEYYIYGKTDQYLPFRSNKKQNCFIFKKNEKDCCVVQKTCVSSHSIRRNEFLKVNGSNFLTYE